MLNVVVSKDDLWSGLCRVTGGLPQRPTSIQILQNMLIEADKKEKALRITATDLELVLCVNIPATVDEAGSLTVPGRKFFEAVREFPEGEIHLTATENHSLGVKLEKTRISLRGTAPEEYPNVLLKTEGTTIGMKSGSLRKALQKTIIATSREESRSFLAGVNFEIRKESQRLIATDGHRLAVSEIDVEGGISKKNAINAIVPSRAVLALVNMLPEAGDVKATFGDAQCVFETENDRFFSRLISEKFPDYEKIIPKSSDVVVEVDREEFLDLLRHVSPLVGGIENHKVVMTIGKDSLSLWATSPEFGEAFDEIPATAEGKEFNVKYNAKYLRDGVRALDGETLRMEINQKLIPTVMTSEDDPNYRYIVMPLRA
ncbi:MAG: DNA polymerase III subunit beta [Candidatus Hydrogenedentota bacterium]|nr:MAG: DNA polymerase III subunit beta [Candidatus Hydrogenedentota bacterium]